MTHLVLISHGNFCEALKESTEMIMGPQDLIKTIPLLPSEGQEDFKNKFLDVTKHLDDYIVLADLMGGTPCNVISKMILSGEDITLYAGMNMPMVIGFINSVLTEQPVDLLDSGIKNIISVNQILAEMDDDDE
ncbi:PTS sugar transporter subunit IIA [Vagococcus bubulae]|uniref:PTS fructose transporter subunit IIA n=1 Tax=Vagococcus bubulae TaxID=1977868 RepID=A0A429ZNI6_9ENTE|nr:PTS fructose transporter subunit IIA [Vagococcus bubulae]RST95238.1 PTS fructose transporter subunit IIA [Vagococcus bubulae]